MSSSFKQYQVAPETGEAKKRDRPTALHIPLSNSASDGELRFQGDGGNDKDTAQQPSFHFCRAEEPVVESEYPPSRSESTTSSLDPYYFGLQSPLDSPAPPLSGTVCLSATPETYVISYPTTPAKDPATIDRRGLVGVGELTTPRWTTLAQDDEGEDYEVVLSEDMERDGPDSPWTIEAIDGDSDEPPEVNSIPRAFRSRPSIAEESGGEEILYPRSSCPAEQSRQPNIHEHPNGDSSLPYPATLSADSEPLRSPPSSFGTPLRKAKKRTSDEFEMDQSGMPVSKRLGSSPGLSKDEGGDEKLFIRKHRSLTSGNAQSTSHEKGKEYPRDSVGLNVTTGKGFDRHTRQTSASSSSSSHGEGRHGRLAHTTDFSHLPPSPSSSSIQHFLRHTGSANTPPLRSSSREHVVHPTSNVAHFLLRGTQEGWSGLDNEATAEALRKLDGLTGKTARARASMSSFGKLSRPGTPAGKIGGQWEGLGTIESTRISRGSSTRETADSKEKEKQDQASQVMGLGSLSSDFTLTTCDSTGSTIGSSDDQRIDSAVEKTPKKAGASTRSGFTPKRGSASSTTYTSTPTTTGSSRDSTSLSVATSVTSGSASGRHLISKTRRNSAGSDVSSVQSNDAGALKDRVASLALGDNLEDQVVPPVPPLPKDLSTYRSPPSSSASHAFPALSTTEDGRRSHDGDQDRTFSLEVPSFTRSSQSQPSSSIHRRQSQHLGSTTTSLGSPPEFSPALLKSPSKKWSFSALNIKLSGSPSSSKSSTLTSSPRSVSFSQQLRKSTSKDHALSVPTGISGNTWSEVQQDAMSSAASLASISSTGSVRPPRSPTLLPFVSTSKTPDGGVGSRSGTDSSASTNQAVSALVHVPLSPTLSVRRGHSSKRLTPSSIPFFRRSSSQSMQLQPSCTTATSSSPTLSSGPVSAPQPRSKASNSPPKYFNSPSSSLPGLAQKKSSVLSLGLPSLLKGSSSRRSLHVDKGDSNSKENQRAKDVEKAKEKLEKEKQKKEDKERSEGRISVLMGRKRGKTLSSTDPKKTKPSMNLPPLQISALPPATAQRVANLKSPSSSTPSVTTRSTSSSRLTSQTVSSMQKQSDASLRSRNQLPTIAGSPSVGTHSSQILKEVLKDPLPSSLMNSGPSHPKETPTKIPRISSRTSATYTPPPKNSTSAMSGHRGSVYATGLVASSTDPSPIPAGFSIDEFGVMENGDSQISQTTSGTTGQRQHSVRASPPTLSRVPRQVSATTSTPGSLLRKSKRDSVSFTGFRKASTSSVTSIVSVVPSESHHRFSALSPSKLLGPKMSLPTARVSNSSTTQNTHQSMASPSSSRQSLSTPSPVPSSIDEEELLGDEEMILYIRRQQAKKMASGATQEELDELLRFPEPLLPGSPSTPAAIIKSPQVQQLSHYERKEILDYPSVYCIGAKSKKKLAIVDDATNNYGYDDERGDYIVVNHDHLAYRYEIIDTLGKGSFGQVLHCRDHCTGESVAIKIIRNKKRFHHQALVEIKILDNLRKWDAEEKHHVIKMTEHFYFRNHLCIAMELLSINLYELIKANGFVGFTTILIRRFTSQMLSSLSLMRHHRIVHCDLKPENVLLRHPAKSALKVIDFGSSCFEHEKIYTYIQSRFYRSPEVILGMNYHMAIDMWSLGCILAELYTGFPIFPGENEQEQLSCIMEVLGIPDKDFVNRSSRKRLFFDSNGVPRAVINSKGRRRRPGTKTLAQVLRCNDEEFVDFISKCLVWDPERRIKPQAAMRHPFITAGRRPKITNPSLSAKSLLSSSALSGNRGKPLVETPKKSQISAPTPLTARSSRTTNIIPSTPSTSSAHVLGSSTRSYRSSQSHGLSYHSSKTLHGFATTVAK